MSIDYTSSSKFYYSASYFARDFFVNIAPFAIFTIIYYLLFPTAWIFQKFIGTYNIATSSFSFNFILIASLILVAILFGEILLKAILTFDEFINFLGEKTKLKILSNYRKYEVYYQAYKIQIDKLFSEAFSITDDDLTKENYDSGFKVDSLRYYCGIINLDGSAAIQRLYGKTGYLHLTLGYSIILLFLCFISFSEIPFLFIVFNLIGIVFLFYIRHSYLKVVVREEMQFILGTINFIKSRSQV